MMLFVLALLVASAAAQDSSERRTLCGRELAKAHSMYCYSLDPAPKELPDSDLPEYTLRDAKLLEDPNIPERFSRKLRRDAELRKIAGARLVEACCLRPCHISELLNHC